MNARMSKRGRERANRLLIWVAASVLTVWVSSSSRCLAAVQGQRSLLTGSSSSSPKPESEEEREDWEAVVQAPDARRAQAAIEFLGKFPESRMLPFAHQFIAIDAFKSGDFESFEQHAALALQGPVPFQELESQLAFYYAESGRYGEAIRVAERLLSRLQPESAPDRQPDVTVTQHRQQLVATARYALGRATLGNSSLPANAASRDSLLEQAQEQLEQALELNPADDYAAYRLGQAYLQQGKLAKAGQSLARAVNLAGFAAQAALESLRRSRQLEGKPEEELDAYLAAQKAVLVEALRSHPRALFAVQPGRAHSILWWDDVPETLRRASLGPGPLSNIRFQDYVGPDACRDCHSARYQSWSKHSHRWMNAIASETTVKGDFSGAASIEYQGGRATFFQHDGRYRMRLVRGELSRTYQIERTVGSRFFQYYVGKQISGPEDKDHPIWTLDHLLPFGYWLDQKQWVPVVHVDAGGEVPDSEREDPFLQASRIAYDRGCSACHTTRPIGDWMIQTGGRRRLRTFTPHPVSFLISSYLAETHSDLADSFSGISSQRISRMVDQEMNDLPAKQYAVTLGISCEACHNGAREHVRKSTPLSTAQPPLFFPSSPYLFIEGKAAESVWGREPHNLNWICGRCHSGSRPRYAGGMDTWNSTEYSDAIRGFCYLRPEPQDSSRPRLRCVDCHDPHRTIGKKWTHTAESDDDRCLRCHEQFVPEEARFAHTRHPAGTPGARCMNCHMPRINEGMQDVVRTHRIFNPTESRMIEANQPNACNLCHVEKGIGWTLDHLKDWYGKSYSQDAIASNYPDLTSSVALGWLKSSHPATRLVAADALTKAGAGWALPALIESLDDPYLLNRQFTQRGLEQMLGLQLEDFGYHFYQFEKERRRPLKRLRKSLLEQDPGS